MAYIEPPHSQVVQHMGLPTEVPQLLEDAQRSLPVLLALGCARPHLHELQDQVRLGLRQQLINCLCFGEPSLCPLPRICIATLADPTERVPDLQAGTNGAHVRTCRALNSSQAKARSTDRIAVMAPALFYQN